MSEGDAMQHVAGYAVALDLTARDIQAQAKAKVLTLTLFLTSRAYRGRKPKGTTPSVPLPPSFPRTSSRMITA